MKNLVGKCRLRYILVAKNMTQTELARRLNTTPQQVQHYVQDTRMMSLATAKKISLILEWPIDELYDWYWEIDDKE